MDNGGEWENGNKEDKTNKKVGSVGDLWHHF